MPPIVALFVCAILVFGLLRLERKQSRGVSIVTWLPTIWFLLIAGKPLAEWFSMGGTDLESGSVLDRYFVAALLVVGFVVLVKRSFDWSQAVGENKLVISILLYMFISIAWSDMPYSSLKRLFRDDLAPVIMSFVIASERNPQNALESIFRRIVYIMLPFSILLIKYYPHLGVQYGRWSGTSMWIGVSMQKNGLALLCLLSSFFFIWNFSKRWQTGGRRIVWYQTYVEIFLFMIALWLFTGPEHRLNYSATSAIALLFGILTFLYLLWLRKRNMLIGTKTTVLLIGSIVLLGIMAPFTGGSFLSGTASVVGRGETLTGRTDIWAYLLPYAMNSILLGHGYGGFWTDALREATSSHAHNGYLDIVLNLGLVGFLLFGIFFLTSCLRARKIMSTDFYWGSLWFCVVLMAVIHNTCESSTISFTGILGALQISMFMSHGVHMPEEANR